jgi:magnesium chelatase subunit D
MAGGGGTPLAAAIDATFLLASSTRRRGQTPLAVFLTDGRANIALDGSPGRERATIDALQSARRMRAAGLATLVLDTSPRPQDPARQLAAEMGAMYLPLPHANAAALSQAVRDAGVAAQRM